MVEVLGPLCTVWETALQRHESGFTWCPVLQGCVSSSALARLGILATECVSLDSIPKFERRKKC